MTTRTASLLLLLLSFSLTIACTNDQAAEPDACGIYGEVSFKEDITPLMVTYCYYPGASQGCHAVEGNTAPGFFETYDGVKNKINFISKRVLEDKNMPPEYNSEGPGQMEPCDLELLSRWIVEGAKDN